MVNTTKIKCLAKEKGIKIGYICEQLGLAHTYLSDVAKGKNTMSDERIHKIAQILNTTYEYLTDQTEDPYPNYTANAYISAQERLIHAVMERSAKLTEAEINTLINVMEQPDDDFKKTIAILNAMQGK